MIKNPKKFETFVINLASSTERMSNFAAAFEGRIESYERISACRGSDIPRLAEKMLTSPKDREMRSRGRGVLGCTLSHVSAWERMLSEDISNALILEDDAVPLFSNLLQFEELGLPRNYDICFVNKRMLEGSILDQNSQARVVKPCLDAVMKFPQGKNDPGAEAYILSYCAARKLLKWFEEEKFGSFVDWRILTYCLNSVEISLLPTGGIAKHVLSVIGTRIMREERLAAYVMSPPLVGLRGYSSDIRREDAIK